ncbi:Glutamate receptor ionotropic, kainate 1 [Portunus trituberculatus]|uniref:Glutamate receptor ionotropic, kainate 1 n=1 Tax=Portunus trituberculatus TaxID=210409 RepID=A0A5B7J2J1_PORTR|nr:Glutamate receptor ionotropic, kainate 1 [Portunus trituberculatus]
MRTYKNERCTLKTHPASLPAGGLFDPLDERQQVAFRYAVDAINSDRTLLSHARLSAQIEVIPPNDSFRGSRKVCSLLKSGVAAIFGPQSGQTSAHVQSICDALEVPHIENRWDFRLTRDAYSVNLYPHPSTLSQVRLVLVLVLVSTTPSCCQVSGFSPDKNSY